jgi:hypothetical protein
VFYDEEQVEDLAIEQMVFHLVGPRQEDFVRLEALQPGEFSDFFLERIRSINSGIPYEFSDASATRERLGRINADPTQFQIESERLASDFQRQHGGSAAAGAFLVFVLRSQGEQSFALLKYDDETVLSYELEEGEDGRQIVSLDAIERTFVQNRDALQKSALIRLNDGGGELRILDRQNQQKVARYFENFLDATRMYEDAALTEKLVKVTREVIQNNKDMVPPEVVREVTRRTYDAANAGGQINADAQKSFLDTVFGRALPDDAPIVAKYRSALRRARIEATPISLDAATVTRPAAVRYRTENDIRVRVPTHMQDEVVIEANRIIINDRVTEEIDVAERT